MPDEPIAPSQNDELKALLLENQRLLKDIHAATQKTRRYILWSQIGGFLKLVLVLVPLVLGYLYIQPYLSQALSSMQDVYGLGSTNSQQPTNGQQITVPQNIWDQLQKSGVIPKTK